MQSKGFFDDEDYDDDYDNAPAPGPAPAAQQAAPNIQPPTAVVLKPPTAVPVPARPQAQPADGAAVDEAAIRLPVLGKAGGQTLLQLSVLFDASNYEVSRCAQHCLALTPHSDILRRLAKDPACKQELAKAGAGQPVLTVLAGQTVLLQRCVTDKYSWTLNSSLTSLTTTFAHCLRVARLSKNAALLSGRVCVCLSVCLCVCVCVYTDCYLSP